MTDMELTVQDGPNTPESVSSLAWSMLHGGEGLADPPAPCAAAVPLRRRDLTGHLVGGDPVIDRESTVDYWAECGEPSVAVYEYRCEHGHAVRKPTCAEHEPEPGAVGCRQCYDQGHECEMQIGRAS